MWRIILGLWWAVEDNKVLILFPVANSSYPRPTVSELLACFLAPEKTDCRLSGRQDGCLLWARSPGEVRSRALLSGPDVQQHSLRSSKGVMERLPVPQAQPPVAFWCRAASRRIPQKFGCYCCNLGPFVFIIVCSHEDSGVYFWFLLALHSWAGQRKGNEFCYFSCTMSEAIVCVQSYWRQPDCWAFLVAELARWQQHTGKHMRKNKKWHSASKHVDRAKYWQVDTLGLRREIALLSAC